MSAGFQCKQFYIGHQHCAMKVGTDALLLGGWATLPTALQATPAMLDIGCGSGILSLMLAQRTAGQIPITAVELDTHAAAQAASNVAASPWPDAIRVIKGDILTYSTAERYALIISNPPFFQDALPSQDATRQQARHTDSLPFAALLDKAAQLLAPGGEFCLILPASSQAAFSTEAKGLGWQCLSLCKVQTKASKPVSRYLQRWVKADTELDTESSQLLIHDSSGAYSAAYRQLLKAFYLDF
jgi:tRNA1Val (adenine37-N6)-methyltransferase